MLDAAVYFPPAISFHEVSSRLFVLMADLSVTYLKYCFICYHLHVITFEYILRDKISHVITCECLSHVQISHMITREYISHVKTLHVITLVKACGITEQRFAGQLVDRCQ